MKASRKYLSIALSAAVILSGIGAGFADTAAVQIPSVNAGTSATAASGGIPIANLYTPERAAELAIKQNLSFKTTDLDRAKLGRQIDDLMTSVNNVVFMVKSATAQKDQTDPIIDGITALKNAVATTDESVALSKETMKDTIKSLFVTIRKAETQLSALNEQVKLNTKNLALDRKKLSLGLISKYDLEKNYNTYKKTERTRDALKTSISKLYLSLKTLMGVDANSVVLLDYSFMNNFSVIPLDHDSGLKRIDSENMKIELYTNNLQRAHDYRVGVDERYPAGSTSGNTADLDYDKAKLTLEDARTSIPYKYETAYQNVMDAYDGYVQKQKDYELTKLTLSNTAVKLKVGAASRFEYESVQTQLKAAKIDLDLARIDYISARLALEFTIRGTN